MAALLGEGSAMDLKVEQVGKINIVHVVGDIDGASASQFQERLLPLVKTSNPLLLELSGVSFMSGEGLRVLLGLRRQISGRGGRMALVGLPQQIKETMSTTGFGEFFQIYASLPEAMAALVGN